MTLRLEVIAGPEGLDPRHQAGLQGKVYTQALTGKIDGLRLGIVPEDFGWEGLFEADVDESVEQAAHAFKKLGARIKTVSSPWHRDGRHILFAIF